RSGTISADGNVCSAAQFAHGGASAARTTSAAVTAATITNKPRHAQARRTANGTSIMIVSPYREPPRLLRRGARLHPPALPTARAEYPRCRHQVDADRRAHARIGPRISGGCRRL